MGNYPPPEGISRNFPSNFFVFSENFWKMECSTMLNFNGALIFNELLKLLNFNGALNFNELLKVLNFNGALNFNDLLKVLNFNGTPNFNEFANKIIFIS